MQIRPSADRGRADHVWARSAHSFSFGSYFDIRHQGVGPLQVLNEDIVAPGLGTTPHAHREVEIVSVVIAGVLEHRHSIERADGAPSSGHSLLGPGAVQVLSAGTGMTHSEGNPQPDAETRFLQMWFKPRAAGQAPAHACREPEGAAHETVLTPIVCGHRASGALHINADVTVWRGVFDAGDVALLPIAAGRTLYVQVLSGALTLNAAPLAEGDGALLDEEGAASFASETGALILALDLGADGR